MKKSTFPARQTKTSSLLLFVCALIIAAPESVLADPPPWAPAHGWRKKHDPYYVGYSGKKWENDYGVLSGRCNRSAVGAVLGGVVGGAVGSQVGGGEGRKVATILGAVLGAAIGAKIGRDMDQADRACLAHAIELVETNRNTRWSNPQTGVSYVLTPTRDYIRDGHNCRDYNLQLSSGKGRGEQTRGTACKAGDGAWRIMG